MPATINNLLDGFKRFKKEYFGDDRKLYDGMKTGQPAKTLMISCCDSRVDPSILTDCNPGDLFTVRNVANLVPPCEHDPSHHGTSAALEFSVTGLEVDHIIVMGHSNCGGINALWTSNDDEQDNGSQFIHQWVNIAKDAKRWVKENAYSDDDALNIKQCEQRAILVSLENLMTFDFVQERVQNGSLNLHGWYFDLQQGELLCYKPEADSFGKVAD